MKSKKWHERKSPQGGWWIGSKEPIRKDLLFLLAAIYNINKLKLMHFCPCYLGSKGLQQACNKLELNKMVGEASGKLRFVQELENGQSLLLFLLNLLKNREQLKSNVPQNTLKVFWVTKLVTEKKN